MAVTDRYTNYQKRKEAAGIVNPEEERQIHDESVARQAEENAREQLPLRPTVAVQKPATSVSTVNTVQERENADKLPMRLIPSCHRPHTCQEWLLIASKKDKRDYLTPNLQKP